MEWTVQASGNACATCGRPFGEREEYWSALYSEGALFARKDYCGACWTGNLEGVFSHWRTRSKKKPAPPKRFVDDAVLLDFFERLCESEDPSRAKLRFIMAVLLLRKRLLKERDRHRDEHGLVWKVEAPRLGKTFDVRDQGLSQAEVADVLVQIGQVLNVELSGDSAGVAKDASTQGAAQEPQA